MTTVPVIAECDVLIVGAGIVGLAHAAEAQRRGLSVVIVERDSRAVGASVRNFGHCCITAQTGELLELAHLARERWLHFGGRAGFFAVSSGAMAIARSPEELAVLDELAASREPGEVRMVRASEALDLLDAPGDVGSAAASARGGSGSAPAAVPGGSGAAGGAGPARPWPAPILGGAVLRDDLRVDPREAVAALAGWLAAQPGVRLFWRTAFLGGADGMLHTSRGDIRAARTIVCTGHDLDQLYPELAEHHGVERCALQMARIEAPGGRRIAPAVLTGTSMLRYPAFAETTTAAALGAAMRSTRPDLIGIGANVMFTQRPDGTIIAGDSHRYDATIDPFLDEGTTDTLLEAVAEVLGTHELRVLERWQGVYASSAQQHYLVAEAAPGVTAVTITSGVGMTISFGVATRTFDALG
ncbi:TIGR03364 family FAD-dependent oxidoreductase [Subtercola sp. YIM 133946]|uniref:TIGR03364 family FAD-dependent oxidoreductase n=1 Tax=Subtercola sp. YIM 133946 TaxID=3118909 RepID=UPI002F93AA34